MLNTSDITEFIPIQDLTNEQVVEWTKGAMGPEKVADIEAGIAMQIEEATDPKTITMTIG